MIWYKNYIFYAYHELYKETLWKCFVSRTKIVDVDFTMVMTKTRFLNLNINSSFQQVFLDITVPRLMMFLTYLIEKCGMIVTWWVRDRLWSHRPRSPREALRRCREPGADYLLTRCKQTPSIKHHTTSTTLR